MDDQRIAPTRRTLCPPTMNIKIPKLNLKTIVDKRRRPETPPNAILKPFPCRPLSSNRSGSNGFSPSTRGEKDIQEAQRRYSARVHLYPQSKARSRPQTAERNDELGWQCLSRPQSSRPANRMTTTKHKHLPTLQYDAQMSAKSTTTTLMASNTSSRKNQIPILEHRSPNIPWSSVPKFWNFNHSQNGYIGDKKKTGRCLPVRQGASFPQFWCTKEDGVPKKATNKWLHDYLHQAKHYESITSFAQVQLTELWSVTAGVRSPNELRTRVCMDLFEKICSNFTRERVVLEVLKREIFNACFYPRIKADTSTLCYGTSRIFEGKFAFAEIIRLETELNNCEDRLMKKRGASSKSRNMVGRLLKEARVTHMKKTFHQWRAVLRTQAMMVHIGQRRFGAMRPSVKPVFKAWKKHTLSMTTDRTLRKNSEFREKIQELERNMDFDKRKMKLLEYDVKDLTDELCRAKLELKEKEGTKEVMTEHSRRRDCEVLSLSWWRESLACIQTVVEDRLDTLKEAVESRIFVNPDLMFGKDSPYNALCPYLSTRIIGKQIPEDWVLIWLNYRLQDHRSLLITNFANDLVPENDDLKNLLWTQILHLIPDVTISGQKKETRWEQIEHTIERCTGIAFTSRPDTNFVILASIMTNTLGRGLLLQMDFFEDELECLRMKQKQVLKQRRSRKLRSYKDLEAVFESVKKACILTEQSLQKAANKGLEWNTKIQEINLSAQRFLHARATGKLMEPLDHRERQTIALFSNIPRSKILDLFPTWRKEDQWQEFLEELLYYAPATKKIFYRYAAAAGSQALDTMSIVEYIKFTKDAKLKSKTLSMKKIRRIFKKANGPAAQEDDILEFEDEEEDVAARTIHITDDTNTLSEDNPDEELIPSEFVECLLRMSVLKNRRKDISLKDSYRNLMEKYVLKTTRSEQFRDNLALPETKKIFTRYKRVLKAIFKSYARRSYKRKRIKIRKGEQVAMEFADFAQLFKDARLQRDFGMTNPMLLEIFSTIQSSEDCEGGSDELVYEEFLEGIASASVYLNPNPYVTVDKKLTKFLTDILLPPLKKTFGKLMPSRISSLQKMIAPMI